MKIVIPARLSQGDVIGIISPAGALTGEKLVNYQKGLDYLQARGFKVVEGENVKNQFGYLAGEDELRLADLNAMLRNAEIRAIFCSRGGYGAPRILEGIDYRAARKHPKILLGYSDITALQLALYHRAGLVSFSGPMVAIDINDKIPYFTENRLWNILSGNHETVINFTDFAAPVKIYHHGVAVGRLLGGCLSVISGMLGAPYLPDFKNAVLLLEDVGEDLYKIDRYFSQLYHAGILQQVQGVILGDFVDCQNRKPGDPGPDFDDIVYYYTQKTGVPVVGNIPYGHGQVKLTLPIGSRVRLNTFRGVLEFLEPVVHENK
ncbi:MAG TPA: LD-carboxypeptidase [bacterium]|nr:LD-carboxypeptidase [bacterium]HPN42075.1 LD-carboxypeptidase [bacterium]